MRQELTPSWLSWDPHPAHHPWLTGENLRAMRAFSERAWSRAFEAAAKDRVRPLSYAFVGNLANNLYMRAAPLRRRGENISIVLHPQDTYLMSQPGWEEWDGEVEHAELSSAEVALPFVDNVVTLAPVPPGLEVTDDGGTPQVDLAAVQDLLEREPYLRRSDVLTFPGYLSYVPILRQLQGVDALLTTQATYLAYLSGRPYLAAQGGGDLWIEASRGDTLGALQRLGFGSAAAVLASNPWTFGHARRLGLRNVIYLPFMIDDEAYSPGPPLERESWIARTGGDFFVLTTTRFDDEVKGSNLALEGFRQFAEKHPGARLVALGWGADQARIREQLRAWGLEARALILPAAGKRRIVRYLRTADCLLDQFVLGAYGATALEAMACALPVVMRLELEQYEALCGTAPPIHQAGSAEEISRQLQQLSEPNAARASGLAHRAWFVRHHGSSEWADTYAALLRATALGFRAGFRRSPLRPRLSRDEREYHTEGLRQAPPFPT